MNGVIWNKLQKAFVPISSVPEFAMVQKERLKQSRALEIHNFQLWNLTLTSFEEPGFLEFYDNDRKVTGLCGDLWNLLSEKLNFTLQPVRSNVSSLGASEKNQTVFIQGLLGIISRNETVAIPKVETYNARRIAADFTTPLWMNSHRLFIKSEVTYDVTWMTKVFAWEIWCFIFVMYLLLSICSFWSQSILSRIENTTKRSTMCDHIFYNFGMICNQSHIPDVLIGRSKILETSLGLFCSILSMSFGALLFIYITKRVIVTPPFDSIDSLLSDTSYKIVAVKGSIQDIAFKVSQTLSFRKLRASKRTVIVPTIEEMFKLACAQGRVKYTPFYGEDEYKVIYPVECRLNPVGQSYFKIWIASGIVRNFKYKRTIDLGILRLKEIGLWDELMDRWLTKKVEHNKAQPEAIGINQISLVILMMCCGMIAALIILY
ncbi:glutamate receptor 1-like isoform X2 [Cardiocondyla obscurior]|uniref:glutamate receptor 1-like isoform X2 n=1 Tax=Cardiocondyla obscurior TaxID=286306 RepID=UPI0039657A99